MLSITGHNSEAGLDAHDSGNKDQQKTVNFGRATTFIWPFGGDAENSLRISSEYLYLHSMRCLSESASIAAKKSDT